jgi:hypothetical protein
MSRLWPALQVTVVVVSLGLLVYSCVNDPDRFNDAGGSGIMCPNDFMRPKPLCRF